MNDLDNFFYEIITTNSIVLFMKGTVNFPQCGFSAHAIQILKNCGVEKITIINVLENTEIRHGIKKFSSWPTIPQLYVNGKFIGGSDIMDIMEKNGELKKLLHSNEYRLI